MMQKEDLVGVWELVSCEGRSTKGGLFSPYGPSPAGKLIYTNDGHLAVILMDSRRSLFLSREISKATTEETVAAFNSFDAYAGRWYLDERTRRVEHAIEVGSIPNWVGMVHIRHCAIENACLTLTTEEFSMGGQKWCMNITWQRPQNPSSRPSGLMRRRVIGK